MRHVLLALKVISLLTLGPIIVLGSLRLEITGGILGCPFPLPFIMCNSCPVFCTFGIIRTGLFYGILGGSILAGRVFCGSFCPGGAIQDLLFKLPVKKLSLPLSLDRASRYLKYFLAVVVVLLVLQATGLWQSIPLIGSLWLWLIGYAAQINSALIALIITSLALSIFLSRAFCRYLCPLGAWISPFNRNCLLMLQHNTGNCIQCQECSRKCPVGALIAPVGWDSTECLRCLECYAACKTGGYSLKLNT
ncbi:MAG TPA: 4Fe-4S binding protein [Dehalococcoidia bacterium]|nr:4Fe-4S binding protein [Dehalococcoidia bacterium]